MTRLPRYELQIRRGERVMCTGVDSLREAKAYLLDWTETHPTENIGYFWNNNKKSEGWAGRKCLVLTAKGLDVMIRRRRVK